MIKLVLIDVDGTLLDSEGNLHKSNRIAIQRMQQIQVHIILNTGKPLSCIQDLVQTLQIRDQIVTLSGGLILKRGANRNWTCMRSCPINSTCIRSLSAIMQGLPVSLLVYTLDHFYIYYTLEEPVYLVCFEQMLTCNHVYDYSLLSQTLFEDPSMLDSEPWLKIQIHTSHEALSNEIYQRLKYERLPELTFRFSSPGSLDIYAVNSRKKGVIQFPCRAMGIQHRQVLAIGDHKTDLPLIQWAGEGFIMTNAPDHVRKAAPHHAPSNNQAGVAMVLQEQILDSLS